MRFIFSPYRRSSGQQLLCGRQSLESGSLALALTHSWSQDGCSIAGIISSQDLIKVKNWGSLSPSMSLTQQRGENPSKDFLPAETPLHVSGQYWVNCLPISELICQPSQKSNNIRPVPELNWGIVSNEEGNGPCMSWLQYSHNRLRHFPSQLGFAFNAGDQCFNLEFPGDKGVWYSDWPELKIIWDNEACRETLHKQPSALLRLSTNREKSVLL